jgi:endonuclease G
MEKILRNRGQSLLKLPNVRSVGIGYKKVKGKATPQLCIQFSVDRKFSGLAAIKKIGSRRIPKFLIDEKGKRVPTDILERSFRASFTEITPKMPGQALPASNKPSDVRRKAQSPVFPGISIGNSDGTAGTLGAIVYDLQTGTPYLLSNWHVLQGPYGKIGDDVAQPGPYDSSEVDKNRIGALVRSHIGIAGDCALASIEGREFANDFFELGYGPSAIATVDLGDSVVKSGRTSGVTYGIVSRTKVTIKMEYGGDVGEVLVSGFEIEPDPENPPANGEVSMDGDSGSLWLVDHPDRKGIAVGLHLASEAGSNPVSEHAIACHIDKVLDKLEVSLFPPQ